MSKIVAVRRGAFAVGATRKQGKTIWMMSYKDEWKPIPRIKARRLLPVMRAEGAKEILTTIAASMVAEVML